MMRMVDGLPERLDSLKTLVVFLMDYQMGTLALKKFDMAKTDDRRVFLIVGKRNSGKSIVLADLLYHKRHIPMGILKSSTEEATGYFHETCGVPDAYIYSEWRPDVIDTIIAKQKKLAKEGTMRNIFIVLDDLAFNKSLFLSKQMRELMFNGRHYGIFAPPFEEWLPWNGVDAMEAQKHYYSDDLDSVRCQLMTRGLVPRLSLRDECTLRSLTHTFPGRMGGSVTIHAVPTDWEKIRQFVKSFGLEYRGEGLPGATWKIVQHLLDKKQRRWLTGEEKHEVLAEHGFRCASCGATGHVEFDHVHALSTSFGEQEFQPLCVSCHRTKTAEEPKKASCDAALASHFSQEAWDCYVLSPRSPPLIHKTLQATKISLLESLPGCMHSDVRRCRTRALLYNVHELPIFCPLDSPVERTTCSLGDLNFVNLPYKCCVRQLGYTGPGWQHRVQTEWLLYTGVLEWRHISHTFTATGRAPADLFVEALQEIERAAPDLSKLAGARSSNNRTAMTAPQY